MKIALVSLFCLDSTMPLAKHLADENVDVHLYGIMPQYNQNVFVVDFTSYRQPNGFIKSDILAQKMGKGLCDYLSKLKTKFFIFPAGSGKRTFFSDIYYAWKFSRHLIKGKLKSGSRKIGSVHAWSRDERKVNLLKNRKSMINVRLMNEVQKNQSNVCS